MKFLRVVNHEKHQHYKNRNPPWIKLHRSCLDSYRFTSLPDAARWHALGIALLASQTDNHVPADPAWLKAALHSTTRVDVAALIAAGFVEPCTNGAGCKHCASTTLATSASDLSFPEEERRGEKRRGETDAREGALASTRDEARILADFERFWNAYPKQVKRPTAERSWFYASDNGLPDIESVLAVVEQWKGSRLWRDSGGQFIPDPHRWLDDKRWTDGPPPVDEKPDTEDSWKLVVK